MKLICAVGLVISALFVSFAFASNKAGLGDDVTVLQAALKDICSSEKTGYLVLESLAASRSISPDMRQLDNSAATSLIHRAASTSTTLLPKDISCTQLFRSDKTVIEKALATRPKNYAGKRGVPGWEGFYTRYPSARGLLRVSYPGYSANGDIAVVYRGFVCGGFCGHGEYVQLRKVGTTWNAEKIVAGWIS